MFQIDLAADGQLRLHMPNGCHVDISATSAGVDYIKKVIMDAQKGIRNQPNYIGAYPTQAAVNKFLAEKARKLVTERVAEAMSKAKKLGIDLGKMEINL